MAKYADLGDFDEDDRIRIIGEVVCQKHIIAAFVVENNKKADRYIKKLHKQFPNKITVIERGSGPVEGMVYVKVGPIAN